MSEHAGVMNAVYRRQVRIYDLTRRFYLLGRDRMIDAMEVPAGGRVLEIACGTGRNLIRINASYPQARLYGMDISSEMLGQAARNMERAGLSGDVKLAEGDACTFDAAQLFGEAEFDRIVFSYCLSMIPDWQTALGHALPLLAPGGRIHVADFGMHDGFPGWFRKGQFAWLARHHVSPRAELPDLLRGMADAPGFGGDVQSIHRDYAVLGEVRRAA